MEAWNCIFEFGEQNRDVSWKRLLEFGELGNFVETIAGERPQFFVPMSLQRIHMEIGILNEIKAIVFASTLSVLVLRKDNVSRNWLVWNGLKTKVEILAQCSSKPSWLLVTVCELHNTLPSLVWMKPVEIVLCNVNIDRNYKNQNLSKFA